MFSKPLLLIALAAALVGAVFAVEFGAPGFLGGATAVLSETFGDVFGAERDRAPAAVINLGEEESVLAGGGDWRVGAETRSAFSAAPVESKVQSESASKSPRAASSSISLPAGGIYAAPWKTIVQSPAKESEKKKQAPECSFVFSSPADYAVIFSEIAWMGSPPQSGESAPAAANNEWLELKNIGVDKADLTGWQILDESTNFRIVLDGQISANGFYLLERTDDDSARGAAANQIYAGALSNSGMWLRLFDDACGLVDEVNARDGWPGGDNSTKQTAEKRADFSWQTSAAAGGTPRAGNSAGRSVAPALSTTSSAPTDAKSYNLAVSMQGSGTGKVTSDPTGINCGFDCWESFPSGTGLTLTASAEENSVFESWSGACGGSATICELTVSENVSITANFKSTLPPQTQALPPPATASGGKILISEIMAGIDGNANYEFIELYNAGDSPIDLNGWELRKRTSSGNESNLVDDGAFSGTVLAHGYFLIASPVYSGTVNPDLLYSAGSASIAYNDNSVVLYNGDYRTGEIVAEISWTEIPAGQSYERQPLSEDGQFTAQSNPSPQNSGQ